MTNSKPVNAYWGHHKCASTWINNILGRIFLDSGQIYTPVFTSQGFGEDLPGFLEKQKTDFLGYMNADFDHVRRANIGKSFHVVRDPRDIVVSGYFSHLHSHSVEGWPELAEHREQLKAVSKDEGLKLEMEFERQFFEHMQKWNYEQTNVLELKMEDLTVRPFEGFLQIFEFIELIDENDLSTKKRIKDLGIVLACKIRRRIGSLFPFTPRLARFPGERILGAVYEKRFSKLAKGRKKGQEDATNHFRKGVKGDWKNHFTDQHKAYFKRDFNDLLLKLGYENDGDW